MPETKTPDQSIALPAVAQPKDIVEISQADAAEKAEIDSLVGAIDMSDTHSIISFGTKAQSELRTISQQMLDGVRNKDTGPAGEVLNDMVLQIRGFDVSDLVEGQSWWKKLLSFATPVARAIQRYESVKGQITALQSKLEGHKSTLLRDIEFLDRQYDAAVGYYDALGLHIAAGKEKLRLLDETDLPKAKTEADAGDAVAAEAYRKLMSARGDLERKVHDLELTRQVTMQALPSIGLVQDNDKSLVVKIDSTVTNTIPLWEIQLSQALTIQRSREAAETIREANDLTNDLLKQNAANLKKSNAEIRTELERGVFDIEAVEQANRDLIDTIAESIQIAKDGKAKRADAETRLADCEKQLKDALVSAEELGG